MAKPCGHPDHPEDGNLGRVYPDDAPRAERADDVKANLDDPSWFLGRYCKLGFPTPRDDKKEYMWVEVESVEGEELQGRLCNHPVHADASWGDGVGFTTDEIIDVCDAAED